MKNILFIALLFTGFTMNGQIETPSASPSCKVEQSVGLTTINIEYSRPSVKDRTIFAADGLVPYGKVWRTGANQATKISFSTDVMINGNKVSAGSYAVLSKPSATNWDVHFYTYDKSSFSSYLEKEPVLVAKATPKMAKMSQESFSISVENLRDDSADLVFAWAKTRAALKLTMKVDEAVMASIDKVMNGPTKGDYYTAASYYHTSGKDLNKALSMIEKATDGDDKKYWQVRRKALILADLGKTKEAVAAAEMSMSLAKTAGNDDYVRMNEKSIKEWGMKKK